MVIKVTLFVANLCSVVKLKVIRSSWFEENFSSFYQAF